MAEALKSVNSPILISLSGDESSPFGGVWCHLNADVPLFSLTMLLLNT